VTKQERLQAYLEKKRADQIAAGFGGRYYYTARKHEIPLLLRQFDGQDIHGVILKDWGDRFLVKDRKGFTRKIDKINLQYCCKASSAADVKAGIRLDADVQKKKLEPIIPRKERYQIPDSNLEPGRLIQLTLRGGEILEGRVEWFGKFDIKMEISRTGRSAVVFRHAVYQHRLLASKTKE